MKSNEICNHCFRPFEEDKFHPGTCGNCGAPLKDSDFLVGILQIESPMSEQEFNKTRDEWKRINQQPYGYYYGEPIYDYDRWYELMKSPEFMPINDIELLLQSEKEMEGIESSIPCCFKQPTPKPPSPPPHICSS